MRLHPITGQYRMHYGEDTIGDGNYATVTGAVVYAGWDSTGHGFGNCVGVREDANPDRIWWTAHFSAILVRVGQRVGEGTSYNGPLGMTGAATGPHAHQECRVGGAARPGSGTAINPRLAYGGGGSGGGGTIPLPSDEEYEDDMGIKVILNVNEAGVEVEVAVCSPQIPNGYRVVKAGSAMTAALRLHSPRQDGSPQARLKDADYLAAVAQAKQDRIDYLLGLAEEPHSGNASGASVAEVEEIVTASEKRVVSKIPTKATLTP